MDSEVGRLRTVLVHRPGAELRRITPQQRCGMLLPSVPCAERAQAEHDAFADALRSAGVAVLYLTELLQDALEYATARAQAIETAISDPRLGEELRGQLREHLAGLSPEELAQVLIMGLARDEFRGGRGAARGPSAARSAASRRSCLSPWWRDRAYVTPVDACYVAVKDRLRVKQL